MMMTKKVMFFGGMLAVVLMTLPVNAALTDLPNGYMTGWGGRSTYSEHVGGGQFLRGRIEFAVYDTSSGGFNSSWLTAPGDHRYLYAYQIFADTSATAALTYFGLTGFNPNAITSADENMGTGEVADGIDADFAGINLSKTRAYYEFENGALIQDTKSFVLLLSSDYAPIIGGYTLRPTGEEVPATGEQNNNNGNSNSVPEPATLALLLGGALMALRKRKR